jgi:hypothetical protein
MHRRASSLSTTTQHESSPTDCLFGGRRICFLAAQRHLKQATEQGIGPIASMLAGWRRVRYASTSTQKKRTGCDQEPHSPQASYVE